MFCTNCGKEIMDGAKFCVHCGTPVDEAVWPDGQGAAQQPQQTYVQPEQSYVPQQAYAQPEQPYMQSGYADDGQEERPSNTKRIKIIAASVVGALVLAGAGTGIFLMASGHGSEETEEEETRTHETKRREKEEVQETQAEDAETADTQESQAEDEETADTYTLRQETLEAKEQELLTQYSAVQSPQSVTVQSCEVTGQLDLEGLWSTTVLDFDEDGLDEMLVCAEEGDTPMLYLYDGEEAGELVQTVAVPLTPYAAGSPGEQREFRYDAAVDMLLSVHVVTSGEGRPLIVFESNEYTGFIADGNTYDDYWIMEYTDQGLRYDGILDCYVEPYSAGVTRYEFQDGVYTGEVCYYDEWLDEETGDDVTEGEYADADTARAAFFDSYQIRTNTEHYDIYRGDVPASMLSSENDMTLCFELVTSSWHDDDSGDILETVCRTENEWQNQSAPQDDGTQENGGGGFDFGRGASGTYKAGNWQAAAGAFMDDVVTIFQDALYADRETVRNDTVTLMKTMVQDTFSVVPEEMVNEALRESGYDSLDDMMAASLTDDAIGNVVDELFSGFDEDLRDQNLLEQGLTNVTVSYEILGAEDVTGYELDSIREIWAEMNVEVSAAKNANIAIKVTDNNSGETVIEDTQSLPLARIGGSWMVDLPAM